MSRFPSRSIPRITLAALAATGLALAAAPALALTVDGGYGGHGNIYCLAPDGQVTTTNIVYQDGLPFPATWYMFAFTPYGLDTPIPLTGPDYSLHPTVGGETDTSHLMFLDALYAPGSTPQEANTGDVPFVGKAFRAGDLHSDEHLFTLFVGPSQEIINDVCEGEFYNSQGQTRPAAEIHWTPKYVQAADGSYVPAPLPGGGGGGGGGSSLSS